MASSGKPTLQQLAQIAGVSTSAVSMILNNREDVSFLPETVRRVNEAAEQLGYQPRGSRSKCSGAFSGMVIIVCPNITSPYYSSLVQSVEQSARAKECDTLIFNTYRSPEIERKLLESLKGEQVAGIIFAMRPSMPQLVEEISERTPTVVICDRDTAVAVDTVETSNFAAGVLIGQHLLSLGHRNIAYISTTLDEVNTARSKRLEGVRSVFSRQCPNGSIIVKSRNVLPKEELDMLAIEHLVGYTLCRECLGNRELTAFVGTNDMVAYGIVDALLEEGYRIPEDYSVCGFDNSFPSGLGAVSLTSVEHCIIEKGHNAFDILWKKMNSKNKANRVNRITRVEYQQYLVPRASTGHAPEKVLL